MCLPPTVPGVLFCPQQTYHMKQDDSFSQTDEPVGIVISSGWEQETAPRFSAYMWAPGPEDEIDLVVQPA